MAGTWNIGVSQFVYQNDFGFSGKGCVYIQFREQHTLVGVVGFGQDFQSLEEGIGFGPAMGLDIGSHHIPPYSPPDGIGSPPRTDISKRAGMITRSCPITNA